MIIESWVHAFQDSILATVIEVLSNPLINPFLTYLISSLFIFPRIYLRFYQYNKISGQNLHKVFFLAA